jgi:N-formylglutamate amidohydrolase
MNKFLLGFFLIFTFLSCQSDEIPEDQVFDPSEFVVFEEGNIPLIISVPHGGDLKPNSIPDRTCNDAVNISDENTLELALAILKVFEKNGQKPYLVLNKMHRSKMDANRNKSEAACGNLDAMAVWEEYHEKIEAGLAAVRSKFNKGLFIDLHGHGNPKQRVELGYLLYEDELALPDETLNSAELIGVSSIQNLARQNRSGVAHSELLKGRFSLGSLLQEVGFPAVPSQEDPVPLPSDNYYSGGYSTVRHSSYSGGSIDGIQIECNRVGIRDSESSISRFAEAFTTAATLFLKNHYFDPILLQD